MLCAKESLTSQLMSNPSRSQFSYVKINSKDITELNVSVTLLLVLSLLPSCKGWIHVYWDNKSCFGVGVQEGEEQGEGLQQF